MYMCVLLIEHLSNCTMDSVPLYIYIYIYTYIYIVGPFPSLPYISNAIQWVNTSKLEPVLIDADVRHQALVFLASFL